MADLTKVVDIHCGWGALGAASEWNDVGAIQTAMTARGVGTVFLSSLLSRRYDLPAGNDALANVLGELPEDSGNGVDVHGWLVIHPARANDVTTQMRRLLYGKRFIGAALYTDPMTGAPPTVVGAHDLLAAFRRFSKPLLIEAPNASAMAEALRIADDLSGVKIIISGMGGQEWREALAMASRYTNLFFDISGALIAEKIEYALQVLHGSRKLLFASGAPQTDPAAVLGILDDLNLSPEDRDRILRTNAIKLFGLAALDMASASLTPLAGEEGEVTANFMIGTLEPPPPAGGSNPA